jgi:citrate synthase
LIGVTSNSPGQPAYVSRQQALEVLGVKPQTLYSYVSRGLVRRHVEHGGRTSLYNLQDLQRLRSRSLARSGHGPAAANAVHWGEPVLSTAITEITMRGPVYREHLAIELARHNHRFESVAEYLWSGDALTDGVIWCGPKHERLAHQLNEIARSNPKVHIRQLLTEVALLLGIEAAEHERTDLAASAIEQARGLICAMIGAFGFLGPTRRYEAPRRGDTVARALARALGIRQSATALQALDRVLVIVADHEFTSATFAARIAASAGNDLYSCVGAALQVHFGAALGLRCDQLEQSLGAADAADAPRGLGSAVAHHLEHPLYRDGDPRAAAVMEILGQLAPCARAPACAADVNLDYALVAVCRALGAVQQAAGGLLAFGRTAGWIAHVFEQQTEDFVIRPRAKFVSPRSPVAPSTAGSTALSAGGFAGPARTAPRRTPRPNASCARPR